MQHLPVTSSVLSAVQLGIFLQDKYRLSAQTACTLLKTFVNDTYLLTDGGEQYIFRVYTLNWRTRQEIAEEIQLVNTLQQNNIPVSYAITDAAGNYIQELAAPEGKRYGVLFSFAAGEKSLSLPTEMHYKIGELMANIHRVTKDITLNRVTYNPQTLLVQSFEKYRSYLPEGSDDLRYMVDMQQYLLHEFEKADTSAIRQGAVHLDIWPDNLNIDAAGNVTLFDFDFCGNGWLCYDIAFYCLQLQVMETDAAEYKRKSDSFFSGYESVTPVSAEEKRVLPFVGASLYFFYMGVQQERFSGIFFNGEHLKRIIYLRIKKWMEFNGI